MRGLLGLLLLLAVGGVVALVVLPWKVSLGIAVALVVLAWFAVPRLLRRALVAPFKAKSRVLAGADVALEAVHSEAPPAPSEDDGGTDDEAASKGPGRFFCLALRISPRASDGPFQLWEPGELRLVAADAPPEDPDADTANNTPEIAEITAIEVWIDEAWQADEGMKYAGEQRLRLHVRVQAEVERVKLRYYFEDFAPFSLPKAG